MSGRVLVCGWCGKLKPPGAFNRDRRRVARAGRYVWCRACEKPYNRAYRRLHLERIREQDRLRQRAARQRGKSAEQGG